jgi:hypothetical protein
MRFAAFLTLPLFGVLALAPRQGSAQVTVTLRLGNPVVITHYAPEVYGDWHTSYRNWQPVTLYFYNGRYYPRSVKGARSVQVYRRQGRYFLPPQDDAWANRGDRRYNYKRRPTDDDYRNAAPPPPPKKAPPGRGRGRP